MSLPEDLARHPRTIRRDLEALEAAHIPLVTERSNGRTRWRLMDGYRQVLPLSLSTTELMALVFSRDLLKPLEGTEIQASLDSALNKAAAALPTEGGSYVEHLRAGIVLLLKSWIGRPQDLPPAPADHTTSCQQGQSPSRAPCKCVTYTASRDRTGRR